MRRSHRATLVGIVEREREVKGRWERRDNEKLREGGDETVALDHSSFGQVHLKRTETKQC